MQKRTRFSVAVCFVLMLPAIRWIAGSAKAQSSEIPTTQSLTTRPADELPADSSIRRWFTRLTDPDPRVRDQAKEDLMGIRGDDLPRLRQLIIESRPISPDQAAALRDIVQQAFLASEKYDIPGGNETDSSGSEGPFFLGMLWSRNFQPNVRLGVSVEERLPGFPSFRFLRRGDMIMGIFIHPDAPLMQFPNMETHGQQDLVNAIQASPKAQNIVLQVLRDGELLKVPVKLAPRPLLADPLNIGSLSQFVADRAVLEDKYWNENFAPLLETVSQ